MQPSNFFKCLSDPTRLSLTLLVLAEGELCVCELAEALQQSQPKISRHLAQLRNCGLLSDQRRGQWVFYRIHPQLPEWCKTVLSETLRSNPPKLKDNLDRAALCC